jgi:predicted RNA-binding protein with PIN domain
MSATHVIDGYNLLFAMGVMRKQMGPTGLEKARLRLLGLLRNAFDDDAPSVTVVFDAAGAPPDLEEEQDFRGLHVRYAIHHEQADDLIEQLIHQSSAPKQLVVVSDDHRIQKAARRRHCQVRGCGDFLDWLDGQSAKRRRRQPEAPEKLGGASQRDTQHWLDEFADLDQDKDMKELFDPFGFD